MIHRNEHNTTNLAYHYLASLKNGTTQESSYIIWHKGVPLKSTVFDWCFLQNHISTTDDQLQRNILQNQQQLCVGGYRYNEDISFALARLCYIDFQSHFQPFMRITKASSANHASFMAFLHMSDMKCKNLSYFQAHNNLYINYSTKLSLSHFDGWNRNMLLSLLIIIPRGLTQLCVWEL